MLKSDVRIPAAAATFKNYSDVVSLASLALSKKITFFSVSNKHYFDNLSVFEVTFPTLHGHSDTLGTMPKCQCSTKFLVMAPLGRQKEMNLAISNQHKLPTEPLPHYVIDMNELLPQCRHSTRRQIGNRQDMFIAHVTLETDKKSEPSVKVNSVSLHASIVRLRHACQA